MTMIKRKTGKAKNEPRLRIYFEDRQRTERVTYRLKLLLRLAVESVLAYEGVRADCEVSITFVDNEQIRELNREYRQIDRATDVLSFPQLAPDEIPGMGAGPDAALGDIVISLERAREQVEEYGHSFERETAFLCVHSMLHLLGYDHETGEADELDMRRRQTEILDGMGLGVEPDRNVNDAENEEDAKV